MWLVTLAKRTLLVQIIHMRDCSRSRLALAPLLASLLFACESSVATDDDRNNGTGGGMSTGGGGQNLAGTATLPSGTESGALLPARIRRLTDAEYQASVSALIGSAADGVSADFVPDSRQSGFTVNDAQRVDPVFARQLAGAAVTLAADIRSRVGERAPCTDKTAGAEACATAFIKAFGEQAYRRPLADDEVQQLLIVFRAGFDGGSYDEGVELVVRAMLQSAAFLYHTEIGDAPAATIKLTPYELASSISYLIQGGPPSAALMEAARQGKLDTSEGRASVLMDPNVQLFTGPGARERVVRVVREWLGIDRIAATAKDSNVYPEFAGVRASMDRESTAFLEELVTQRGGSLRQLLAGDWSVTDEPLARVYGAGAPGNGFGTISLPRRLGMLNQGAFLSVYAHAHESAPVLRGVAVMRRVACIPVADPVDLAAAVVPPAPDPSKTTRERFAIHSESSACSACHNKIDAFGFAFEHFDGMGKERTVDNGRPVDSAVTLTGTDFDGSFANSNELALAISKSAQVRECFARHVFRGMAGTSVPELRQSEDDFVKYWSENALSGQGADADTDLVSTLSAYITHPAFAFRRAQ